MLNKEKVFNLFKQILKNRFRTGIVIGLVIILGLVGWRIMAGGKPKTQYQTAQAEKGTLIESISASGQVSSTNNASISTQASGVVSKVYVLNDQKVKVGEKIAELELDLEGKLRATQAWASYQSAKNNLDSAQVTLYTLDSAMWSSNRAFINDAVARSLATNDPTYIQENDNWLAAEAKYKNQQNVVSQAQTSLTAAWLSYQQSSPIIYAPISGTVTGLSLQEGIVLVAQSSSLGSATSQKIASIKTNAPAQLAVNLTEIDVTKIKIGNKASITLDALSGKTYTGKVISIDTIGSVSSGVTSYPAVIGLDTEVPEILPNMAVNAEIITNVVSDVIIVPTTAITTTNDVSTILVKKNNKFSTVQVEIGSSNDSQTEIKSGLNEGDEVVTSIITSEESSQTETTSPFSGVGRTSGSSTGRSSSGEGGPPAGGFGGF